MRYFNSSPEVIRLVVMMYVRCRCALSRILWRSAGSTSAIRPCGSGGTGFGPMFAAEIRKRRVAAHLHAKSSSIGVAVAPAIYKGSRRRDDWRFQDIRAGSDRSAVQYVVPTVNLIRLAHRRESRDELPHAGRALSLSGGGSWVRFRSRASLEAQRRRCQGEGCRCRKINPSVLMVQSTKNWRRQNASD